jgi:hypothetical protein
VTMSISIQIKRFCRYDLPLSWKPLGKFGPFKTEFLL